MGKPHIAIMMDSQPQREVIKKILVPVNADFLELSDRKNCAAALGSYRPDLIIAKITTASPDKNNWCELIKPDAPLENLPVILMGHGGEAEAIAQKTARGGVVYIDTGKAKDKLIQVVRDILEEPAPPKTGSLILVVDDSSSIRMLLKDELSGAGYRVMLAENGRQAIDILRNTQPDIILSDVYMPEMNGIELCRTLHGDPRYTGIPFVVMSTENDAENMKQMMQFGAAAFIIKPFNLEQLMMTLNKICSYEFRLLIKENERLEGEQKLLLAGITSLVRALEARDQYTRGHSERVSDILVKLVRHMGGSRFDVERARIAGQLHDIGKIGIRDDVLLKPGSLDKEEFNHIKQHPLIGSEIIQTIPSIADILPVVMFHHERVDGKGYPEGRSGSDIPVWARLTAVADTYDALTSDRPYRKGMAHEKAVDIIKEITGTQLCPESVGMFLEVAVKPDVATQGK
ncbi:MAG: response regulator [Desulfobacterales bacterium]|nr:response regulator [Desulfobacterales bacterium]